MVFLKNEFAPKATCLSILGLLIGITMAMIAITEL